MGMWGMLQRAPVRFNLCAMHLVAASALSGCCQWRLSKRCQWLHMLHWPGQVGGARNTFLHQACGTAGNEATALVANSVLAIAMMA